MAKYAIEVNNVGMKFNLSQEKLDSLKEYMIKMLKGQLKYNEFWALKNVNFKVEQGDRVGILGLNGAGKSTLLKVIAGVFKPTEGQVIRHGKLVPLLEGTCIRTEKTFQSVYEEDPFFPLFVAYRRHHASVRIYVDLMLFYFGATLAEAVKIYQDELGFDWITARKQVQAHQSAPGYFTCYYYGLKKLAEWEEEYHFTTKEFTELLFSPGYICIDRFGEFLALTDEQRSRYMNDFASLLR